MIWFNVKEAYDYLIENKEVFTLRPNQKKFGKHMLLSSLEGKKHYKGTVEILANPYQPITIWKIGNKYYERCCYPLENYVSKSGFPTRKKWLDKVYELHKLKPNKEYTFHLHHVKMYNPIMRENKNGH